MSKIFKAQRMKVETFTDSAADVKLAGSVVLFPAPKGPQQDDFNRLAQQTLGLRQKGRGAVLFFASSTSGEGASYVSYNLAVTLAEVYSQRVAWVDANFLSPQKAISGPGRLSLSEMLTDPKEIGVVTINSNPFLIPGGKKLMGARGLVATSSYQDVLDELCFRMNVVHHEDNQSCVALVSVRSVAYDGKDSHNIRRVNFMHEYFRYEENRSEMVWCNTLDMIADILTKDLHGELFTNFKAKLMGWT